MANLGYWQMKVSPGVWYLQLAPGRSSDLYLLKEDGSTSPNKALSKRITIDDLRGKVVHMEVAKKRGLEREKLLVSSDDDSHSERKNKVSSCFGFLLFLCSFTLLVKLVSFLQWKKQVYFSAVSLVLIKD